MRQFQVPLCLAVLICVLICAPRATQAQQAKDKAEAKPPTITAPLVGEIPIPPVLTHAKDLTKLVLPSLSNRLLNPPMPFGGDPAASLRSAILNKLGIRYRFYGTNDNGYDCSGFVWRVFQDAGVDFQRVAARSLWSQLPEPTPEEIKQFGTLVFFNDLKHVGIVRDATTFYHASSSKGVTVSEFAGYWEKRITGYRRAPLALIPQLMRAAE
ncbi:MAG: C40 family peptidase [Acidobacteria bacterium]|nr:C40 family peptidase [Acidobacteriota bacterium]